MQRRRLEQVETVRISQFESQEPGQRGTPILEARRAFLDAGRDLADGRVAASDDRERPGRAHTAVYPADGDRLAVEHASRGRQQTLRPDWDRTVVAVVSDHDMIRRLPLPLIDPTASHECAGLVPVTWTDVRGVAVLGDRIVAGGPAGVGVFAKRRPARFREC